jgi:hypothetical protein
MELSKPIKILLIIGAIAIIGVIVYLAMPAPAEDTAPRGARAAHQAETGQ